MRCFSSLRLLRNSFLSTNSKGGPPSMGPKLAPRLRPRLLHDERSMEMASSAPAKKRACPHTGGSLAGESGFVLILFLALLPAGLALMFALLAGSSLIKERREAMNNCRRELLKGLTAAEKPMTALLALNPLATSLRTELRNAELQEAASLPFPPIAAHWAREIARIKMKQAILNARQEALYAEAAALLEKSQNAALLQLKGKESTGKILRLSARPFYLRRPALHRTSPDLAPDWEPDPNFPETQALEQKWQWSFQIRGPAAHFLGGSHTQEEKCSATLENQTPPWNVALRR